MIGYLLKNWKLGLDLILVVGGIIAFTVWDPFGMFSRVQLKDTANLVSSVRGIGELVTAEYYGEVVSSLHESKIYNVPPDPLYKDFEGCWKDLRRVTAKKFLKDRKVRSKNWTRLMPGKGVNGKPTSTMDSIKVAYNQKDNKVYNTLMVYLALSDGKGNVDDYYDFKDKKLRGGAMEKALRTLIDDFEVFRGKLDIDREDITLSDCERFCFDVPTNYAEVTGFHYELKKDAQFAKRRRAKRDIVFIGRGWVKAGFRFDQLDESNFYYNEESKLIQMYGLTPAILDKDINPWFIPENKIKGFELVDYYNDASFEEAVAVKKKCKEKLLAQAERADILKSAQSNGEEALKGLFALLLDEPQIQVEFMDYPYDREYQMIAADTLVTVGEALEVGKWFQEVRDNDSTQTEGEKATELQQFSLFLERLEKLDFMEKGSSFSLMSLEAAKILKHALFVTNDDYLYFKKLRNPLKKKEETLGTDYMDKLTYYKDYHSFTKDFNQALKLIDKELDKSKELRESPLYLSREQADTLGISEDNAELTIVENTSEQGTVLEITHKQVTPPLFIDLRYPMVQIEPVQYSALSITETDKVQDIVKRAADKARFKSKDPEVSAYVDQELNLIIDDKTKEIIRQIQLEPLNKFTNTVRSLDN